MHSVNTRFSVPAEPAKGAVHLPALSISRENCKTVGETVFSNESAGSGRRKVAPGGGGSGTGVVPTPVGNTPWLLMVVLALLKCSVFCHGVISDSFRRQFGLNSK